MQCLSIYKERLNSLLAGILLLYLGWGLIPLAIAANPINSGNWPDPHVSVFDGQYWIYPSADMSTLPSGLHFYAFSSTNLVNWTQAPNIALNLSHLTYANYPLTEGWAPAVAHRNGTYYFYFSVQLPVEATVNAPIQIPDYVTTAPGQTRRIHPSVLFVATSDSPAGPFANPIPLATSVQKRLPNNTLAADDKIEAIDPMVFTDEDGTSYLYYGGSWGSQLVIQALEADMVTPRGIPQVQTILHNGNNTFTEAPFVHKRQGLYFLTYSNGSWWCKNNTQCTTFDNQPATPYSVQYATAEHPLGPWQYGGTLLTSDERYPSPGHNSILQRPGQDEWYIVYHRWGMLNPADAPNDYQGDSPNASRQMAIEKIQHRETGRSLQAVSMTDTGVFQAVSPTLATGVYRIVNKASGLALDMAGCRTDNGTNVGQYHYWGETCQQWEVSPQADGSYAILATGTTQALDRVACQDNGNVILYEHLANDCQRWQLTPTGDNAFKIVAAAQPTQSLSLQGCSSTGAANTAPAANVEMQVYAGHDCQLWYFDTLPLLPTGTYKIRNRQSGLLLTAEGDSRNGANVVQQFASATPLQHWRLEQGTGNDVDLYSITLADAVTQSLDRAGCFGAGDNPNVMLWEQNPHCDQRWRIVATDSSGRYFRVLPVGRIDKSLEVFFCNQPIPPDTLAILNNRNIGIYTHRWYDPCHQWEFIEWMDGL